MLKECREEFRSEFDADGGGTLWVLEHKVDLLLVVDIEELPIFFVDKVLDVEALGVSQRVLEGHGLLAVERDLGVEIHTKVLGRNNFVHEGSLVDDALEGLLQVWFILGLLRFAFVQEVVDGLQEGEIFRDFELLEIAAN